MILVLGTQYSDSKYQGKSEEVEDLVPMRPPAVLCHEKRYDNQTVVEVADHSDQHDLFPVCDRDV